LASTTKVNIASFQRTRILGRVGTPKALFPLKAAQQTSLGTFWQPMRDGQRFLVLRPAESAEWLVEVDGDPLAAMAALDRVRQSLLRTALKVQEAGDGSELWAIRRYLSPAVGRIRPNKINEDIVVPRRRIGELLERVRVCTERLGVRSLTYGHAGDGNLHVNYLWDTDDEVPHVERRWAP
jgi:FAD/FMN-containing dehydrogenase